MRRQWKAKKRFCAYRFFAQHNYLIPISQTVTSDFGWVRGGYVAYVTANQFDKDSKANARLIAAAPDMLEALKEIAGWIEHNQECRFFDSGRCTCRKRSQEKKIADVIAKAEGR